MTADPAYDAYLAVRDAVARIKAHGHEGDLTGRPSDYWEDELANIDYLMEASPLIVRKLRHHAFHITGIRPYDYRLDDDPRRQTFAARLDALAALGGDDLVVAEHEALGGFGYRLPRGLFNIDTLKFLEVLVGMKQAGVLDELRRAARPTVVEIGGGWGGFAYQLKTVIPAVRYVIVDFPELFLFSATYLKTVFPAARVVILGQGGDERGVDEADFVFVPHRDAARVVGLRPQLTVNMVSFQEMTSEQVTAYAAQAHAAGCPVLYSLNRERSRYNAQLTSVSERLLPYYELRDVHVLDSNYMAAMRKPPKTRPDGSVKTAPREEFDYRHIVGHRRPQARVDGVPHVGIGATSFNRAGHLREALDSILAQTYPHFRLVVVDDGSTDDTERIAREYAARDSRVTFIRHEVRQGMTATWRHAFEAATAVPGIDYFAWASDHDTWDPTWLERLVGELDRHPETVLAYPLTRRVDQQGALLEKPARLFETAGMRDTDERWRYVCRELVASGDMVYGLARVDAVRRAGVFRDVLCPDRLLMAELALQGEFRQVPQELWFRRQFGESSVTRQRTSLFAGRAPAGRWQPVWYQHGRTLWRTYVAAEPDAERRRAAKQRVLRYSAIYALRHHQKSTTHKAMFAVYWWLRGGWKKAKHYTLLGVFYTLVYSRRAYHRSVYELAILTRRLGLR